MLELRRSDISFHSDHMSIFIHKSKNDQLREGKTLVISKTSGDLCPVRLLQSYLVQAESQDSSSEYIFRPITSSKNHKKVVSVDMHISYSTYRESFKGSFKNIVTDIQK